MGATIKQIAQAAGVSRGTVDRVLHKRGGVSPEIEKRILQLSEEMGFFTNRAGKILAARKRPTTIGVFMPSIGNAFFTDIVEGYRKAEAELADFGTTLEFLEVEGFEEAQHLRAIEELAGRGHAALCVSTLDTPRLRDCINAVVDAGCEVVTVNTDLTGTKRLYYVGCDYLESGRTTAGMLSLIQPEPHRVLIATGSNNMQGHVQRIAGFEQAMEQAGAAYTVADVLECKDSEELAYEKTYEALARHTDITCLYLVAGGVEGACRAVKQRGLENAFCICSYDDVPYTRQMVKEGLISFTISQEPAQQGYRAVNMLFDYFLSDRQAVPESYFTQNIIRIRQNL